MTNDSICSKILGKVLKDNKGLTELDIEANSLTPKAATVLANSISFNHSLLKLNINGNVLGKTGAQALVVGYLLLLAVFGVELL